MAEGPQTRVASPCVCQRMSEREGEDGAEYFNDKIYYKFFVNYRVFLLVTIFCLRAKWAKVRISLVHLLGIGSCSALNTGVVNQPVSPSLV